MTRLYPSMAFTNIKNNRKTYIPYMLSCIVTIALYYIVCSLGHNESINELWGGNIIQSYMGMGQVIVSIFALIFLFYINSFLVKRRIGEFGLYNILGMEKGHICRIMALETLFTFALVMVLGLGSGILLDRLVYLVVLNILGASIPLGFYVSWFAICKAFALFGVIFFLIFLNSLRQIYKAKPVDLLKSDNVGEREPKVKWVLAILGLICLFTGYFIAVVTENPVAAITLFFAAVILVIVGTYLLFTAGSIALLKILKKKKGYYYKTNHFISVSGMMYRMKRNAVGLANICVLSTMVLVMVSCTLSMYLGVDDSIDKRYPGQMNITALAEDPLIDEAVAVLDQSLANEGLEKKNEISYRDISFSAVYEESTDEFVTEQSRYEGMDAIAMYNKLSVLVFVPLEDYNEAMDTHRTLEAADDVLVYSNRAPLESDDINVLGKSFQVAETLDEFVPSGNAAANITNSHFIVVKDMSVMYELLAKQTEAYGEHASYMEFVYMTDVAGDPEETEEALIRAYEKASAQLDSGVFDEFSGFLECRPLEAEGFLQDFSGLFFIGIFLGLLFIMATVLIMYYKQITEGYEDKKRFEILQNVGMSHREVRKSIGSQILVVFFLPLVTAGIHVAFAFPFLYRIMMLMNLFNLGLFAVCTIGCFLVFAAFYTIVYLATAKLYYGIVKK
ncbi:MAG: ABC transporter permease [Bacillota bacterium]|nr:ABC transporter permease [Bacillota bacterium]